MMRNITSADNLLAFLRCTASEYQPKGAANTQHSEEAPAGKVCYARHPEVLQLPQSFDADLHRCISGHQSLQTDQAEEHGAILYPLNSLHDPVHPLIGRPLNEACNSLELGETFSYAEPETEPNQPRFVRARSPVIPAQYQASSDATHQTARLASASREPEPSDQRRPQRLTRRSAQLAAVRLDSSSVAPHLSGGISDPVDKDAYVGSEDSKTDDDEPRACDSGLTQRGSAGLREGLKPSDAPKVTGRKKKRGPCGRPRQSKPYDAYVDPNLPANEIRRIRRVLSNRESARRSRKRKACQISGLEGELQEERAYSSKLEAELSAMKRVIEHLEKKRTELDAEVTELRCMLCRNHAGLPVFENDDQHFTTT